MKRSAFVSVGGCREVGFSGTDLLLVVSSSGRGVLRLPRGERVARDDDASLAWLDETTPAAEGIGPLAGQMVPVAGLSGGRLATARADGASLTREGAGDPQTESVVLEVEGERRRLVHVWDTGGELVAYGFSPCGEHVIVATTANVSVYTRRSG